MATAETHAPRTTACAEYLEDHAAYIDGFLSDAESASHEAHAAACASCARYARVLKRGLSLVRELPEIEPSAHFEERLRHRIFHIEEEARQSRSGGRSMVGLAAAAVIAMVAWSPLMWRNATADRAEAAFRNAISSESSNARMPLASNVASSRDGWYVQPVSTDIDQMPVTRLVGYAGSYSPLIVSPPAYARGPRAVRLVSATSQ